VYEEIPIHSFYIIGGVRRHMRCLVSLSFRGFGLSDVQDGTSVWVFRWSSGCGVGSFTDAYSGLTALMVDLTVAFVVGVLTSLLYAKAKHHSLTQRPAEPITPRHRRLTPGQGHPDEDRCNPERGGLNPERGKLIRTREVQS